MGALHGILLVLALLGVLCMPALLVVAIAADEMAERAWRAVRRGVRRIWGRRLERRLARRAGLTRTGRLLRRLRHGTGDPAQPAGLSRSGPVGPPIEQVAADLRRLGRQRVGVATRSPVWFAAVQRAYDEGLIRACRALEIEQHLRELSGIDQDIERVRIEGMLAGAGLRLYRGEVEPRHDPR